MCVLLVVLEQKKTKTKMQPGKTENALNLITSKPLLWASVCVWLTTHTECYSTALSIATYLQSVAAFVEAVCIDVKRGGVHRKMCSR